MSDGIQYTLSYDHRDLFVRASFLRGRSIFDFLKANKPSDEFYDALDYFCQRFYPEIHADERPWVIHRNWRNKKNSTAKDKLNKTIETKSRSWPLAWYWKALLPGLPTLLDKETGTLANDAEVVIRLSQVRQWVLAIVYKEEANTTALKEVRQTLLRPPLLGRSDRITLWDQYLTLLPLEKQHPRIRRRWKNIHKTFNDKPGSRFDEELWYVIGRHDLIYTIKPKDLKGNTSQVIPLKWKVRFVLDPQKAEPWEVGKLEFSDQPKFGTTEPKPPDSSDVQYPYDLVRIPCFQDELGRRHDGREGTQFVQPESVLLSSDKVCQAYEQLTEVWNDKTTKSVLIVAPSGSGKELLARSNHFFQERKGKYIAFAFSASSQDNNDHTLFSRDLTSMFKMGSGTSGPVLAAIQDEASGLLKIHEETRKWAQQEEEQGEESPEDWPTDGLIFKARKGTLFLDEIDKVPKETRASLLRLLENDEFAVYGTPVRLRLKEWRPLYVVAGSLPIEEMLRLPPEDFWNRMIQRVVMEHPLEVDDPLEQQRIARNYFHLFWLMQLKAFFQESRLLPFQFDPDNKETAVFLHCYYLRLFKMLKGHEVIHCIGTMFAEEVCTTSGNTKCSIRNIKVAASRVIYGLVDYFLYGKSRRTALHRLRERVIEAENGKEWTRDKEWFDFIGALITRTTGEPPGLDEAKAVAALGENLRIEVRDIVHVAVERVLD